MNKDKTSQEYSRHTHTHNPILITYRVQAMMCVFMPRKEKGILDIVTNMTNLVNL